MNDAGPATRLAVYGSLAPGEANRHVLADLSGSWRDGYVHGELRAAGWGSGLGYPGLVPDAGGDRVPVRVFESPELPRHWRRLDAFEGREYRRIVLPVHGVREGALECNIYVLADATAAARGARSE